jgi:hypothetical protein
MTDERKERVSDEQLAADALAAVSKVVAERDRLRDRVREQADRIAELDKTLLDTLKAADAQRAELVAAENKVVSYRKAYCDFVELRAKHNTLRDAVREAIDGLACGDWWSDIIQNLRDALNDDAGGGESHGAKLPNEAGSGSDSQRNGRPAPSSPVDAVDMSEKRVDETGEYSATHVCRWGVLSTHSTTAGLILYMRCQICHAEKQVTESPMY